MDKDELMTKIGSWAFIIGILVALLVGLMQAMTYEEFLDNPLKIKDIFFSTELGGQVAWALALLGIIVGILAALGKGTISRNETQGFLLAGISLIIMGGVFPVMIAAYHLQPYLGSLLEGISVSLAIFIAPAVGILAIKTIWDIGRDV